MDTLNTNKQVQVLNDLVQINNDRIAGYQRAMDDVNDEEGEDLKPLFQRLMNNSLDYNEELEKLIGLFNGEPALGTSGAGKVYRAWMDFKALVTGGDRKAILESCETGEQTALRAYDEALAEEDIHEEPKRLIPAQRADILQAYEEIKALKEALI